MFFQPQKVLCIICSLFVDRLFVSEGQTVEQRQFLTFSVLDYFELFCDVVAFEGGVCGLSALWQEDCEGVLVAIEGQILPYEFVDDQILIGEIWTTGRAIIESAKDLSSDSSPYLREYSPFFEGFFEDFFQFVDAGHLKFKFLYIYIDKSYFVMEVVSPKSVASQPVPNRTFRFLNFDVTPKSPLGMREGQSMGAGSRFFDLGSRVDNLPQGRDLGLPYKATLLKDIKSKRPLLVDTQQKIFSQVIGLVDEIDELKESIWSYQQTIRQIQIEHPDVQQQVGYHGYSEVLTVNQCNDLEDQNLELQKQIQSIESRQMLSLQQVLLIEKQRYEQLKQELLESTDPAAANKAAEQKISELKVMISELENERKTKVKVNYPGIDRLKGQNQELRQKTIANLRVLKLESEEERELGEYLRREEANRLQFMDELRKFKAEFKRLKTQNETLKEKKRGLNSKENSARVANSIIQPSGSKNTGEGSSNKEWLQVESAIGSKREERRDRLSEYQNFIKMMQNTSK